MPYKLSISSAFFILTRVIHHPLPSEIETRKAFFSQHWWTWYILSLVKVKSEFIFSVLAPSLLQPVSKFFFL